MTEFLIFTLIIVCVVMAGWSLLNRERMLQFPGLASWVVGFLIIPQLVALNSAKERLPAGSLDRVVFMVLLCLLITYTGYYASKRPPREFIWRFSMRRLFYGGALLAVVGQVALVFLQSSLKDIPDGEMWSGLPIRYLFFAQASRYAFSIGLVIFTLTRKKWALLLTIPNAVSVIQVLLYSGKRSNTAVFALTILCAFWFSRRKAVPRWMMVVGILAFTAFVVNVGDFRALAKNKELSRVDVIRGVNWSDTFTKENYVGGNAIDMENAANVIAAVDSSGRFDYGAALWNWMVMTYVPRQLVGSEAKQSLLVGENVWDVVREINGYSPPMGTCATGIAEAFYGFWYYGAFLFYILGYIMRRLWEGSMRGGVIYQVLYFNFIAMAINVYNGTIGNMVTPWLHMLFFLMPVFFFAKVRPSEDVPSNSDILRPYISKNAGAGAL